MNNPYPQPGGKGISQSSKRALRNPWVLGWLALVLTVVGVNSFFIAAAVITSPGLVDDDYYEKGRDHEKNWLKRREAHQSLGWQYGFQFPEQININTDISLSFNVVDEAGLPLQGAVVSIAAYRPSDANADFTSPMKETLPGMYENRMRFSLKGIWDLIITVQQAEKNLELRRRISVQG